MGANRDEVVENMMEAIYFHLEGLKEGLPIPPSNAEAENLVLKI